MMQPSNNMKTEGQHDDSRESIPCCPPGDRYPSTSPTECKETAATTLPATSESVAIDVEPSIPLVLLPGDDDSWEKAIEPQLVMRCTGGDGGTPMLDDPPMTSMANSDTRSPLLEVINTDMEPPLPLAFTYDSSPSKAKASANIRESPINAQSIPFYEVEAHAVSDDSDRRSVYDAVLITDSWWKEHQRAILISFAISIVLIATAIATSIGIVFSRTDDPTPPPLPDPLLDLEPDHPTPASTSIITPPPLIEGMSGVVSLGASNGTGCDYNCRPYVAMDENTAVIAPWSNKILNQIYTANKMDNGSFKTLQAIDVNAKEQRALSIASNVLVVGLPNETEERGAVYVYNRDSKDHGMRCSVSSQLMLKWMLNSASVLKWTMMSW